MPSLLNPVIGLLMLRVRVEGDTPADTSADTPARRPYARCGTTTRAAPSSCVYRDRRGAPTAQPHSVSVGQNELSALVSGSRSRSGAREPGPVARIAYSVPSAASKRWSTT